MKRIILTCLGSTGDEPSGRFYIDVNDVGDAQIVRAGRPLVERDRSTSLPIGVIEGTYRWIDLAVEVES